MALYAFDDEGYLFAGDAEQGVAYRCLECSAKVKVRRGKDRLAHFYHLQKSPRCRLYSKSEDHLLIQLHLQKLLADPTAHLERPLFPILRISDLLWEKEKIAFEIQCSSLSLCEAKQRIVDYKKAGYRVVWLLDDRIFNRRSIRDAEQFLRGSQCYYFSFKRNKTPEFYDQIEIILENKRWKKGPPFPIDLTHPLSKPQLEWPTSLPKQIEKRIQSSDLYFAGDLLHKTILSARKISLALFIEKYRELESTLLASHRKPNRLSLIFQKYIVRSYHQFLDWLIQRS